MIHIIRKRVSKTTIMALIIRIHLLSDKFRFQHMLQFQFVVDTSKQDAVLSQVANIGSHCVKDFCQPLDVNTVENVENCRQNITSFGLSAEVDAMLEPLHNANRSTTFAKLWEQQCVSELDNCSKLVDVVERVWKPVQKR